MAYKIIAIEGIGEVYAAKLNEAGIIYADDYLEQVLTPKQRKAMAEKTGISEKLILRWANHIDLFRIHGVGPQYAELLECAGVDTVKELAQRNAENLQQKLEEVNEARHLVRRVPALKEVVRYIAEAKTLPGMLTY